MNDITNTTWKDIKDVIILIEEYDDDINKIYEDIWFFEPDFIEYYDALHEEIYGMLATDAMKELAPDVYAEELEKFVGTINIKEHEEYQNLQLDKMKLIESLLNMLCDLNILVTDKHKESE